jgi:hypothetical protein
MQLSTAQPPPGIPYGTPPTPPPSANYPMGGYGMPVMQRASGLAIAGFVLSFFCSVLGLIFSIIGYNECKQSNGTVTGEGLALAGIIISIISLLLGIAMLASVR